MWVSVCLCVCTYITEYTSNQSLYEAEQLQDPIVLYNSQYNTIIYIVCVQCTIKCCVILSLYCILLNIILSYIYIVCVQCTIECCVILVPYCILLWASIQVDTNTCHRSIDLRIKVSILFDNVSFLLSSFNMALLFY